MVLKTTTLCSGTTLTRSGSRNKKQRAERGIEPRTTSISEVLDNALRRYHTTRPHGHRCTPTQTCSYGFMSNAVVPPPSPSAAGAGEPRHSGSALGHANSRARPAFCQCLAICARKPANAPRFNNMPGRSATLMATYNALVLAFVVVHETWYFAVPSWGGRLRVPGHIV